MTNTDNVDAGAVEQQQKHITKKENMNRVRVREVKHIKASDRKKKLRMDYNVIRNEMRNK